MHPLLRTIDGFPAHHGFTLRRGGVSRAPYASLNLGDAVGDDPEDVAENRRIATEALGAAGTRVRVLRQVHGARIVDWTHAAAAGAAPPEADAHCSADPADLLVVSVADCLPILFHDPVTGAAAAAHCGWRGTRDRLAARVVVELARRFGARPADLHVAVGPGIAGACYQVGIEVVDAFRAAGFPADVARADDEDRFRLDLAEANRIALLEVGVEPTRIVVDPSCTHCDSDRFFSYRRDGVTGRHWAVVRPGDADSMDHAASSRDHAAPPRARRMSMGPEANA